MAVAIRAKSRISEPGGQVIHRAGARARWRQLGQPGPRHRTALLAPNLILYSVFIIIPVVLALALSFTSWNLVGAPQWVGLANYRAMVNDPAVPQAIETTMIFLVLGVVPTVVLGLLLAMLVNVQFRFVGVVRPCTSCPRWSPSPRRPSCGSGSTGPVRGSSTSRCRRCSASPARRGSATPTLR